MFPVSDPRIPKIAGRVSVVEQSSSKVAAEISAFYNSCENLYAYICFEKKLTSKHWLW